VPDAALRAALTGTAPAWAMLALAGAGLAHWLDLRQRGVLRPG
jgi:hypothetical protein